MKMTEPSKVGTEPRPCAVPTITLSARNCTSVSNSKTTTTNKPQETQHGGAARHQVPQTASHTSQKSLLPTASCHLPHQQATDMAEPEPFAQTLLTRAFSPSTASTLYNDRITKRPLPIRATSPTPSARAVRRRALNDRKASTQKRSAQKPRPLSASQKRKLALHEIPKAQQKYSIYEPLHRLWAGYIRSLLNISPGGGGGGAEI